MIKEQQGGIKVLVFSFGGRRFWRRLAGLVFVLLLVSLTYGLVFDASQKVISVLAQSGKLRPIYGVGTTEKKVALTFDATWGAERPPQLLKILKDNDLQATFFLVNIWLDKYPEEVRQIAAAGHEIGLHSATHPHFTSLSPGQMETELKDNHQKIKEITGCEPVLFRPPYGDYDNTVIEVAGKCGYKTIQWSVDSLDWKDLSAEEIYNRVIKNVHPGSIILFHNDGKNTPEALLPIIQQLRGEGYRMVPVSALIYQDNYYIDVNGIQQRKQ